VALPARTLDLNPVNFIVWGCLILKVYHDGKPEVRDHLL
jgi:hypothetical protein